MIPFLRSGPRPIPVLRYAARRHAGDDAADNDAVALADDLAQLAALGCTLVPLTAVVAIAAGGGSASLAGRRCVALAFDEGPDADAVDGGGANARSLRRIVAESALARAPRPSGPLAVSFVVASPRARARSAQAADPRDRQRDDWWADAAADGTLGIGALGWDPDRVSLSAEGARSFATLADFDDAQVQVRGAQTYVDAKTGGRSTHLLAWPGGTPSEWLVRDYMPSQATIHRVQAAFGMAPRPVARGDDRWNLPRYVCGRDWRSAGELAALLRDAHGASPTRTAR